MKFYSIKAAVSAHWNITRDTIRAWMKRHCLLSDWISKRMLFHLFRSYRWKVILAIKTLESAHSRKMGWLVAIIHVNRSDCDSATDGDNPREKLRVSVQIENKWSWSVPHGSFAYILSTPIIRTLRTVNTRYFSQLICGRRVVCNVHVNIATYIVFDPYTFETKKLNTWM